MEHRIGPYKVIREIAEDRLGQLFEAVDSTRNKHVVIRSLRPEAASRPEVLSRLHSEARTLASLNHPNIARIFGFIRVKNKVYLVMEFVSGKSLRSVLKEKGRLDPNLALATFHQIFAAVKFAHELRVVHGDLKPSNILISSFAQIKVLNFALAPILGDLDIVHPGASSAPYMAPERIARQSVDLRSDIYSLGVLLYEAIVGRVPFTGDSPEEIRRVACQSTPLPPSLLVENCPNWLDAFLVRTLAASPHDRFQSVAAMAQAMGPAVPIRRKSISAKPVGDSIRRGVQRISSVPPTLLGAASRTATRMVEALAKDGLGIARHKQARAAGSMDAAMESRRRTLRAANPWNWAKRAASKIQAWTHGIESELKSVSTPVLNIPGRLKKRFAGFAETNWKRYVVLATLVVSVLIETFIFGGANTLLNPDLNSLPVLNQNEVAQNQNIVEPLSPVSTTVEPNTEPEPQPRVVKRVNRGVKISEQTKRTNAIAEDLHHEALSSKRIITYRDNRDTENSARPVLQEARVIEPVKRNPENDAAKTQLNVRWEN